MKLQLYPTDIYFLVKKGSFWEKISKFCCMKLVDICNAGILKQLFNCVLASGKRRVVFFVFFYFYSCYFTKIIQLRTRFRYYLFPTQRDPSLLFLILTWLVSGNLCASPFPQFAKCSRRPLPHLDVPQ